MARICINRIRHRSVSSAAASRGNTRPVDVAVRGPGTWIWGSDTHAAITAGPIDHPAGGINGIRAGDGHQNLIDAAARADGLHNVDVACSPNDSPSAEIQNPSGTG